MRNGVNTIVDRRGVDMVFNRINTFLFARNFHVFEICWLHVIWR